LSDDDEINKRDFDKMAKDETIKSLNDQLGDSALKSSTRILMLVLLAQARRMSSVELRTLTGLGKGSLENHLNKLESFGYVEISNAKSLGGRGSPMRTVEITEKGLSACRTLVKSISGLAL
jgi:DNA-binding MarR family transcriptional regulator